MNNQTIQLVNKKIIYFDDSAILVKAVKEIIVKKFPDISIITFTEHDVFTQHVFDCLDMSETIDLIITDFLHPSPNCYELAKAIRSYEQKYYKRIPILVFTMVEPNTEIIKGLRENVFNKYLSLTIEEETLFDYIDSVLY